MAPLRCDGDCTPLFLNRGFLLHEDDAHGVTRQLKTIHESVIKKT